VPEHAELHLLLSMITPLGWLERVPTYKDQQAQLKEKDLATYGFLGYPLLQSADILLYRPDFVPVGEDQVAHVEMTREVARRFNHLYGREPGLREEGREGALKQTRGAQAREYSAAPQAYQEQGDGRRALPGRARCQAAPSGPWRTANGCSAYLEGEHHRILPEPEVLLTPTPKVPGLDGRKMSKSYGNTIGLREDPESVAQEAATMQTDPARVRRTDPGDPEKCPVWDLHKIYSERGRTGPGCDRAAASAGIGCLDCKKPLIERVVRRSRPRCASARRNSRRIRKSCATSSPRAREGPRPARATLEEVRRPWASAS
jgi:tryptophanyl-tRNA synthetase